MNTALFVMLPVMSHYNACFGLADQLRQTGTRVIFTGIERERNHVEREGFAFVSMPYLEEYTVPGLKAAIGLLLKCRLDRTFLRRRYREFYFCVRVIENLCERLAPTTVYVDQHLNHYFFLLPPAHRNVVLLNTKLPTRRAVGIPPLTSSVQVRQNWMGKTIAWVFWERLTIKRKVAEKIRSLVFLGKDDQFFLQRQARKNGLVYAEWLHRANALFDSLRNLPIIHLRPQTLEYEWYNSTEQETFAYFPYERTQTAIPAQMRLWELVAEQKRQGRTIVYASLGTVDYIESKDTNQFLSRLAKAVRSMPDVCLLIANRGWVVTPDELPENVYRFDWVPQPELLMHCRLMITHGGMNSICDCLKASVPMLAYPLNLKCDQPGNAARVEAKGWGIKGNLRRDRERAISRNITRLLADPLLAERMRKASPLLSHKESLTTDLAESYKFIVSL